MYHILVADDEAGIRALIRKYAEFEGHDVAEASNGMDAVRMAVSGRFDIVVTRSMSKFNWRTGLFAAKRNRFSIPIYSIKEGFLNE